MGPRANGRFLVAMVRMTGGSAVGGGIRKLAVVSFYVCGMLDGPAVVVVMTPNRKEVFPKKTVSLIVKQV